MAEGAVDFQFSLFIFCKEIFWDVIVFREVIAADSLWNFKKNMIIFLSLLDSFW
jgi:hypothetical protein